MSILSKIFGDANEKYLKSISPFVLEINSLEGAVSKLRDEQFKERTQQLKERVQKDESLKALLAEAFALCREVAKRQLNQRHFDVQLIGGIALHEGKIAEMRTGEGKTLTATLPVYLNALTSRGVHVVTVNDYLAKRDTVWMGQIYDALGMSIGCVTHENSYRYDPLYQDERSDEERDATGGFHVVEHYLRPCTRKEAYAADITYGTNNEFGFDYLRDNMAYDALQQVQRGYYYAIIDEVDSILIDEARTPLIISTPDMESSHWYKEFSKIIPQLKEKEDYEVDEKLKAATLTETGITKLETILGVQDIYQEKGIKYLHHLEQSLKAETLFKRDKDYVVRNNEVIIVDEFTGRLLPGRRYSGGLHQALEAKEGVFVQPESLTLASVTFQNYFRLYEKIAGMTGTALTSAEEFYKVYKLDVIKVPTAKPMIRKDLKDKVYQTVRAKFSAVAKEVKERHEKGQPVLVGTVSIEKNELLGELLEVEGIPHNILNAKNNEKEAEVIAQAGKFGAVTVATNMAGRGVDIILGGNPQDPEEARRVVEAGGLLVIGTERHEARRIDNQLRGRSGRQGDPGASQFFVSLEDDLIRIFGGDRMKSLMQKFNIPEDQPIESGIVSNAIESAQSKIEGFNFDARKHLLDYDDVLNKHREIFYKKRNEILKKAAEGSLKEQAIEALVGAGFSEDDYIKKEKEIGPEVMKQAEKVSFLRSLDYVWIDHLENMESLRDSVRLRAYGQQDPLVEYKREAHRMFQNLLVTANTMAAQSLVNVSVTPPQPTQTVSVQGQAPAQDKVGRNDPCPCGSGKKYKKCHGK